MKKFLLCWFGVILLLSACAYDSTKAVKNGDVVNMHGPVYNLFQFERFVESIHQQKKDEVRITNYSLEGDPTIYNLSYDGASIDLRIDRSKNKNRGDAPAKEQLTCSTIVEEDGEQLFIYTLEGCDRVDSFTILSVAKEHDHDH
ncbi:DUF4362 domain-containing protein [Sporosarcina sp. HYO08]|uniref:DUF4362 domain-containing protein n=1 Tax=Sporosarcina sp. HYO08 TaxID=1759557 RepID=UPI000795893D|nr:DUF4362 domain-containing protein [Sporosarcina sp. HYO08]KXH81699.1 hypothetical protein AU377_05380 [Sporosarcina sp. HYO08]